ncbi:MAG TPA: tetratricopeptide repeat protein, partial [Gemmatimonadaceae bacterium]|nr:tetratricopeptide repeat protein [Gemmatimonadaceae bacterium]
DLYALGAVAYEMLCGAMLFPGRSPQATMAAHAIERPVPVSQCRPDAPPALALLVMQLLEKSPDKRPASASEVLARLEHSTSAPPSRPRSLAFSLGVAALAIVVVLTAVGLFARRRGVASDAAPSIAVLPFDNTSGDKQDEYFSDGMAEELMTQLNKVPGLRVAARTSAFAFKGRNEDAREIGKKLGVGTVLEGSVRKAGTRMRVSARLVDARTGYQIWADEYQRDVADVFAVQDEVTAAIVGALRLRFAPSSSASSAPHETRDVMARDAYLQGRFYFEKRDEQNLDKAVTFFSQALARDSMYAAAWAGLSETYAFLATFGYRSPAEMVPKARAAAERAVLLDSTIAETHTAKGFTMLFYGWDYPGAEREFKRAIEANPQYAPARLFLGWDYLAQGRLDDAVKALETARELDPLSLILNTRLATMLYFQRKYPEALNQARQTLAMDSGYALARYELARGYLASGRCKDALAEAEQGSAQVGDYERTIFWYAHAICGQRALAEQQVQHLVARARTGYAAADVISMLYVALGDKPRALDWLERAYDQNAWAMYA